MNKKRILQLIAMVLVLSMMLSTTAFALPPGHVKQLMRNKYKFENAFKHMKENGIMFGYGNGDYGLGENVKRGDITVMIVRAFKLSMMDVDFEEIEDDFLDLIDKNSYYYCAVQIAKNLKIARGDGKNFYPNNYVSYEEAVLLIERAVKVANSNVIVLDDDGDEIKLRDWYKDFVKEDEDAFREYLYELLEDEGVENFKAPATREDIALMLYHVLTSDKDFEHEDEDEEENEIKDIKLYLEDFKGSFDRIIRKNLFTKAFEEIEDDDYVVEYLIFDDMDEDEGELYYLYDAEELDDNIKAEDDKYYFDNDDKREIEDLTFVAGDENISYINYKAYIYNEDDKDYDDYEGRIIISIADKKLDLIKIRIEKETTFDLDDLDDLGFENFIEEIEFNPEKDSKVTLKINGDELEDKKYETDDIKITLIPVNEGKTIIDYTAYDEGMLYTGVIEVTVRNIFDIDDIEIDEYDVDDEDEFINFVEELEEAADEDIFDDIDYVKFKLPDADEGKLLINYGNSGNYVALVEDDEGNQYTLSRIKGLQFEPEEDYNDDEITILYTAYDKSTNPDKAYDGKMIIELEIEED